VAHFRKLRSPTTRVIEPASRIVAATIDLLPSAKASFNSVQHEGIQCLLFSGGGDLDPLLYGEENRASEHVDDERDKFEFDLMRGTRHRPAYLCNLSWIPDPECLVWGTLLQDIPSPPYRQHAASAGASAQHTIELTDESRLYSLLAKLPIAVNSRHHQAVTRKTLACPLVATAFSSGEDIIERIEKPGPAWVVGVQWHPERIEDNIEDTFQVLFRDFIRAAAELAGPK